MDALSKESITKRMIELTGLENLNSVMQLSGWLQERGLMLESLGKKEVAAAIKDAPADIAEVLSLRLMLAKSSVKKYQAMENSVCEDDRCHGMFSFYGANRTGRWSGRLIQLQNLYRNSMPDLEAVRDLVKIGDYEMLDMLYDNVPQVLSELVRTAFIPRPGYKFIVADFSAIEARVIAHLPVKNGSAIRSRLTGTYIARRQAECLASLSKSMEGTQNYDRKGSKLFSRVRTGDQSVH